MGPRALTLADEGALSSGYQSPVYRESSASYPPLSAMQHPVSPSNLNMQLQALQYQLQLQSANGPTSQLQQPHTSSLGNSAPMPIAQFNSAGPTTAGFAPAHVLLVANDSTLAAIFRQALSQAPVLSVLYVTGTLELGSVLEQFKKATGRVGPDIAFFQPEVLMANPGMALRLKQVCGGVSPMVVLQGSEAIARALQADDFMAGPTATHPLRKEDLGLMILKWRSRQQVSASSSTVSSNLSAGGASVTSAPTGGMGGGLGTGVASMIPMGRSITSSSGGGVAGSAGGLQPGGAPAPQLSQVSQLQALQAQLQALQQAKQENLSRGGVHRTSNEIEPAGGPAGSGGGPRGSPPRRPPPLLLSSAGVTPTYSPPDVDRAMAAQAGHVSLAGPGGAGAALPIGNAAAMAAAPSNGGARGVASGGGGAAAAAELSELMAQVAELRRKLGDKSRTTQMRSPTVSGGGGISISPTSSLGGNPVVGSHGGGVSAGGAGLSLTAALGSGPAANSRNGGSSSGGGGGVNLNPQLRSLPANDLQLQLQNLQQMQQALLQKASTSSGGGGVASLGQLGAGTTSGVTANPADAASAVNRTRRQGSAGLQTFGSLARGKDTPSAVAPAAAPPSPGPSPASPPSPQLASMQLQQQLLQLQQLQLQLQQQHQRMAPPATGAGLTLPSAGGSGGGGPFGSPPGSHLSSAMGSPLPSPGGPAGTLQNAAGSGSGAVSDSSTVSRSNSFVAAGGTRYRPPRQRSPSPLGGAVSGHLSDTYPGAGPGTSRFASPQFRSGSGSGVVGAGGAGGGAGAGGAGGRRGPGTGSGHTSDSGASPDVGPSARNSMRSGSSVLARKSGDDAIAAALSAASGEVDGEAVTSPADSATSQRGTPTGAAAAADRGSGGGGLTDALRGLETPGDGGSSTDGRSLMDASFALEDSGGGGRGSVSGGGASSIDLLPSPVRVSGGGGATAAATVATAAAAEPATRRSSGGGGGGGGGGRTDHAPLLHRNNQGGTSLGSHRLSANMVPEQEDEEDAPLRVSAASRQPTQATAAPLVPAPAAAVPNAAAAAAPKSAAAEAPAAAVPKPAAPAAAVPKPAAPAAAVPKSAAPAAAVPAAVPSERPPTPGPAEPAQSEMQPAAHTADDGAGSGPGSPVSKPRAPLEDDLVRVGSPDSAAQLQLQLQELQQKQKQLEQLQQQKLQLLQQKQLAAARAAGQAGDAVPPPAPVPVELAQGPVRLPSIDGTQPLTAAVTRTPSSAAAADSSLRRKGSGRSEGSDRHRQAAPASAGPPAPVPADIDSPAMSSRSAGGGLQVATQTGDGASLVASIEGSIAPGPLRTGAPGPARAGPYDSVGGGGGSAAAAAAATSSSGAVGSVYTDDIFAALQLTGREWGEVASPAPLSVAPPRSSTPPARRAARILLSSHPIVITREDFLPL